MEIYADSAWLSEVIGCLRRSGAWDRIDAPFREDLSTAIVQLADMIGSAQCRRDQQEAFRKMLDFVAYGFRVLSHNDRETAARLMQQGTSVFDAAKAGTDALGRILAYPRPSDWPVMAANTAVQHILAGHCSGKIARSEIYRKVDHVKAVVESEPERRRFYRLVTGTNAILRNEYGLDRTSAERVLSHGHDWDGPGLVLGTLLLWRWLLPKSETLKVPQAPRLFRAWARNAQRAGYARRLQHLDAAALFPNADEVLLQVLHAHAQRLSRIPPRLIQQAATHYVATYVEQEFGLYGGAFQGSPQPGMELTAHTDHLFQKALLGGQCVLHAYAMGFDLSIDPEDRNAEIRRHLSDGLDPDELARFSDDALLDAFHRYGKTQQSKLETWFRKIFLPRLRDLVETPVTERWALLATIPEPAGTAHPAVDPTR